jgi:hypothetical protein
LCKHCSAASSCIPTWDDDSRAEGDLLILSKKVVWVAVEHHAANRLHGEDVLRPGLGHIKRVKVKPADETCQQPNEVQVQAMQDNVPMF